MAGDVRELRPKPPETEKITINLGFVDLGHVDLMVPEGFYSNRTDFIRTAIRNQLERHAEVVKQSTARKSLDLGLRNYSREDLEAVRRTGETLHVNVLGLACISQTSRPSLLARRSLQFPRSAHCMPVRRSKPPSPTDAVKAMLNQEIIRQATCSHACRPTR